jgi:hypothetical protein
MKLPVAKLASSGRRPWVSVVMPSLNQAQFLETAVRSVLAQDYEQLDLVVADGMSTDGSQELLVRLQREFGSKLRWVSQQDDGPAQAVNAALALAQGEIIGWLNSDDMYAQGAVTRATDQFASHPEQQLVYGLAQHMDAAGHSLGAYPTRPASAGLAGFAEGSFICQPTVFMRREALAQVGVLDESLKTAFDMELWLRFFKLFAPQQIGLVRHLQAFSRLHPACLTQRERRQVALEGMKVLARHLGTAPAHWFWTHVDELCASYPLGPDSSPLLKQLERFINEVKGYLEPQTLEALATQLRADARLSLAKPGLFATVQPDGWVSKRVDVKYHWQDQPASAVVMRCAPAWPVPCKLRLRVRLPGGQVQTLVIEGSDEFVLSFEVPPMGRSGCTVWTVETSQSFVPARHEAGSSDKRSLSFKVLTLEAQHEPARKQPMFHG